MRKTKTKTLSNPGLLGPLLAFDAALVAYRPPPKLTLIEWSDRYRRVASKTSATPGRWRTSAQPIAYGPMDAVTDPGTHTITVMSGTQLIKTELLINTAAFYIHQDPSPILLVQPTQNAAANFSKERFAPTIECTPALRDRLELPKAHSSDGTITHKDFAGGSLDFCGANSPIDLASRPKRIILCDEIDKWPLSAGSEGDPLKLSEERASTYRSIGRAKFVRTCSPTVKDFSRIEREFLASDQRKCFVECVYCGHHQVLSWAHVRWDHDAQDNYLPETASIVCESCGTIWTERDRIAALNALEHAPGFGWKQTRPFFCCGETHTPKIWNDRGRSVCPTCEQPAAFAGHAGFHCSKLYSKRHRLPEIVTEFLEAGSDQELLRKWINTALAESWAPKYSATFNSQALLARVESYGPDDLPEAVKIVTGFADVQGDRLEVQLIGWGAEEEAWPFQYTIIHQDPAQPYGWRELDVLLRAQFTTTTGRSLRVAAFGIDTGGHHSAQVYAFCRARRGRRIFATKGAAGNKPIWPGRPSRSHTNDPVYLIGVDAAKETIYARLNIPPAEPGFARPGFIHFPAAENFGPEYFRQLNSERRQVRKRMGQPFTIWVKIEDRNEVLDTFVGCLAVRKSLPRFITAGLEYSVARPEQPAPEQPVPEPLEPETRQPQAISRQADPQAVVHEAYAASLRQPRFVQAPETGWINPRRGSWIDRDRE